MSRTVSNTSHALGSSERTWAGWRGMVLIAVPAALLWCYWSTLQGLMRDISRDPNYSIGQLVPLAALYLLWLERRALVECRLRPTFLWGIGLLLCAQLMRVAGLMFMFESIERYSIVVTLAGTVLLIAGPAVLRQVGWVLAYLCLAIPLPGRVHNMISGPLQDWATSGAVFTLELLGFAVVREGHIMVLNGETAVAVAEACSGLRMLTAFIVVSATLAYVVERPRWQKTVLLLSSVPVALASNLLRLVVTSVLFIVASSESAERFFHDFAGLTMMPLALLLLGVELWVMSNLVIEDDDELHRA